MIHSLLQKTNNTVFINEIMKQKFAKIFFGILFLFLFIHFDTKATHIRAGEIIATRTSGLTYCFTIYLYTDDTPGTADSPDLDLNFGDGTAVVIVPRLQGTAGKIQLANETKLNIYEVCHTYSATGTYLVTFEEPNRNADVRNMSNSVNTPFSVSTFIFVNQTLGLNSTPAFTVPPLDLACPGQRFIHNPGAFDIDGDSLSFKLVSPKATRTNNVNDYTDPDNIGNNPLNEEGTAPSDFSIDARTGDLVWNSPLVPGEYNVAFIVEEWRNGVRIGFVTRDMQILVVTCTNKRPDLVVEDVCVVADEDPATTSNIIDRTITATDPDVNPKDEIIITSQSSEGLLQGVYDPTIFDVIANFTFSRPQFSPASGTFRWDTRCEHVREQPYIVVFKAEDQPVPPRGPKLVDVESMLIKVKGPPPLNLTATPDGRRMDLAWADYRLRCPTFTTAQFNAMQVVVWRREGCLMSIPCDKTPAEMGYVQIGTIGVGDTTFKDNGPLKAGLAYSYVITVNFPKAPVGAGGVSQASAEVCVFIPVDSPLITKVSVDNTNQNPATDGQITINYLRPRPVEDLATISATFPPPYRFELYRSTGLNAPSAYTLINTQNDAVGTQINYTFTDTGLNTENTPYHYKVEWFTAVGTPTQARRIPSDSASSVRLTATPAENSIVLTWEYNVPWSNQNQIHEIFRGEENQPKNTFVKVGEVLVGQRRFVDIGSLGVCLDPDKIYCYYVKTKGTYSNPNIPEPAEKLLNDSQIDCASPLDTTPPPPPVLTLAPLDCENFDYNTIKNSLSWTIESSGNPCQDEIATYRLYFRPLGSANFTLLPNPPFTPPYLATTFVHENNFLPLLNGQKSQAGCYYVTAVDKSGNESDSSNVVCQDNCILFHLPNVFTPTGDLFNEAFAADEDSVRYVETVKFTAYNRWGAKVKEIDNDILINWDGKNEQGQPLPSGIYYYEAIVRFYSISETNQTREFKGWIKLIRKDGGE